MMETRQPAAPLQKQDEILHATYQNLLGNLSKATEVVNESQNLYSIGVYDDLFKVIERATTDPLGMISDKLNSDFNQIQKFLNGMVYAFASVQTDIKHFESAKNSLYYFIVLNDDSLAQRTPFLKFLYDYEQKPISKKFPIFFDFITEEIFKEIKQPQPQASNL